MKKMLAWLLSICLLFVAVYIHYFGFELDNITKFTALFIGITLFIHQIYICISNNSYSIKYSTSKELVSIFRNGLFGDNKFNFNSYSSKEIVSFLPIIMDTILSLHFSLSWLQKKLLLKLFKRINNDKYLLQSFSFYIHSNKIFLSKLKTISNNIKNKRLKQYIDCAIYDKSAINFFYNHVYKKCLENSDLTSISIKEDKNKYIYDPINHKKLIILSHIKIIKIMPSNARPILIECWSSFKHPQSK